MFWPQPHRPATPTAHCPAYPASELSILVVVCLAFRVELNEYARFILLLYEMHTVAGQRNRRPMRSSKLDILVWKMSET